MSENPRFDLDTFIRDGKIIHELKMEQEAVTRWVMNTRDKATTESLIKMGWTPHKNGINNSKDIERCIADERERKDCAVIDCMSVKRLKEVVANASDLNHNGEPAVVWVETRPCKSITNVDGDMVLSTEIK